MYNSSDDNHKSTYSIYYLKTVIQSALQKVTNYRV